MSQSNSKRSREERAERAIAMRKQREAAERRRARIITIAIVAVSLVVIVAAGIAINQSRTSSAAAGSTPKGLTSGGGFLYTQKDVQPSSGSTAPATSSVPSNKVVPVVLYEDFQCPVCKAFEAADSSFLMDQVANGSITIEYRPIAILNTSANSDYSSRSGSAAACTFEDAGIAAYVKLHGLLYISQPQEGGSGLPDSQLTTLAQQAGASSSVASCISKHTYAGWVNRSTDAASKSGLSGTPTIMVAGKTVTGANNTVPTLQLIQQAIDRARAAA
ncbi:MAG: DsbA family protein [Nocardioidaceae bacterium]